MLHVITASVSLKENHTYASVMMGTPEQIALCLNLSSQSGLNLETAHNLVVSPIVQDLEIVLMLPELKEVWLSVLVLTLNRSYVS